MENYVKDKVLIVTGAASGFGRLVSQKAIAAGAKVVCADINEAQLTALAQELTDAGGAAIGLQTDVANLSEMQALAAKAVDQFGRIDVMVNNAGVMPLAFYADHQDAAEKWNRCIDINIKGVLNGIISVYDQMMAQEEGHVINISSIYGNFPVAGAGVYGASKSAVNFLSESLRVEARGKIKVTTVKPTGVPATGLAAGIVNAEAVVGIVGQNQEAFQSAMQSIADGQVDPNVVSQDSIGCAVLEPDYIADQVIYAINQPKGVTVGEITMRGAGDFFVL
jgi:NADP-dependent 3-hydroxy acid dehydrogenase YdfG